MREEIFNEIGSDYWVKVWEDDAGHIFVTDTYAAKEGIQIEKTDWNEAVEYGKSFIHDKLPAPPVISLRDGRDIGHCGICDLYEDAEAKLKDLLASGSDFDTGWAGSSKELDFMRIVAQGDSVELEVSQEMDDIEDLVYDATSAEDEYLLTEELHNELIDWFYDAEIETSFRVVRTFPRTVSYDDLMQAAEECLDETGALLKEQFSYCQAMVKEALHPLGKAETSE